MIGIVHCFAVTFLILQLLFHLEPIHATNGETFLRLLYGSSKKAIEVSPESRKYLFIFIFGRKKNGLKEKKLPKKALSPISMLSSYQLMPGTSIEEMY